MSIGKGLSAKKRWRAKNGVDIWECCSQYSGIILQEHGPVFSGTSECTSLRIILTMVAKIPNTVDIVMGIFITIVIGCLKEGWHQGCLVHGSKMSSRTQVLLSFSALPSHFPLKVAVWLQDVTM